MRILTASIVGLLFFGAIPQLCAAQSTPSETNSDSNRVIDSYFHDLYARKFEAALSDVRDLDPDSSNPIAQADVAAMRASALLGMKHESDAQLLIGKIDALSPTDPEPRSLLFEGALISDHFDVAADSLDTMIARFPDAVRSLDWELVRYLLAHEPKGQEQRNQDRRIALARIGYRADTAVGHMLAAGAVNLLLNRGDTQRAREYIHYMTEPESFEDMLILRRYSALWPVLEEQGGAHLANVRELSAAEAERAYLAQPDDHEMLANYVNALRHAGRLDDAIALRARLPQTREAMASADEQTGWAVNNIAYALYEAGRADEGDQLLAMLNEPQRTDAGWRVSMIINRLEMLTSGGKFEKAASLLDLTEQSAKSDGTPFAQQLVRRLRYCILASLGKKDDAAKVLPEMLKHADDAPEPTLQGLLCAENHEAAENLALKMLNTSDKDKREQFEAQFVRDLQPVPLTSDDPSVWDKSWVAFRRRPAIAAAYEKLGRDLPSQLLPAPMKAEMNTAGHHGTR